MKLNDPSRTFTVPCSHCGQEHTKTLGWLKTQPNFTCSCGTGITIDVHQFTQVAVDAQKSLDSITAQIRKLGKR